MAQQIIDLGVSPNSQTGDPIRVGGQKINDNFTEVYDALQEGVPVIDIDPQNLSGNGSLKNQVVDEINSLPTFQVTMGKPQLYKLPLYQVSMSATFTVSYPVYYFIHLPQADTYGSGGTQLNYYDITEPIPGQATADVVDLGGISVPIEQYINNTGPYTEDFFKVTINGTDHFYRYTGTANSIGQGQTQVTASDFVDLLANPTPNLSIYLQKNDLYGQYTYKEFSSVNNISGLTQDYYLLNIGGTDAYFAIRQATSTADLAQSELLLWNNGQRDQTGKNPDQTATVGSEKYDLYKVATTMASGAQDGDTFWFNYWRLKDAGELVQVGQGYMLDDEDPNDHGTLGQGGVDFSHQTSGKGGGALGANSFASGVNTKASGYRSNAEGYDAIASGEQTKASGQGTEAKSFVEVAQGFYNDSPTPNDKNTWSSGDLAYSYGNGTQSTRSNLIELWKDGRLLLKELTKSAIDAASNKIAITKEWFNAQPASNITTQDIQQINSAVAYNIFNQNKDATVTVSGTTQTQVLQPNKGSNQFTASDMKAGASYSGVVLGKANLGNTNNVNVVLQIYNTTSEISVNVAGDTTTDAIFKIEYNVDFLVDNSKFVFSGTIRCGSNLVRLPDTVLQNTGLTVTRELNCLVTLTGSSDTLEVYKAKLNRDTL